ncbi:hypothetical protein [Nannocystis exedens]|uniref:hypothetical protein n=1 Tax=Nannocystis exedens TaxID=54 RepID=UPI001FE47157|nr:hypothetical protein [Nannocystis exedens]
MASTFPSIIAGLRDSWSTNSRWSRISRLCRSLVDVLSGSRSAGLDVRGERSSWIGSMSVSSAEPFVVMGTAGGLSHIQTLAHDSRRARLRSAAATGAFHTSQNRLPAA